MTSTQKDRLSERPLHKKHSFKPCWEPSLGLGGKTKRERKRLNLFLFYSHSHPPPSLGLAPSQWPAETGEDLWCAESTAVQFSHEPSFFGGGVLSQGLIFLPFLAFWWKTLVHRVRRVQPAPATSGSFPQTVLKRNAGKSGRGCRGGELLGSPSCRLDHNDGCTKVATGFLSHWPHLTASCLNAEMAWVL